jgi:hypothetical protein
LFLIVVFQSVRLALKFQMLGFDYIEKGIVVSRQKQAATFD